MAGELRMVSGNSGTADEFGFSVSADANLMLAGAPGENLQSGAAYLVRCDLAACVQEARLVPIGLAAGDNLGADVVVSGSDLFVSAPGRSSGRVYAYARAGAGVVPLTAEFAAIDGSEGDLFGSALAYHADTLVVGSPGDDNSRGSVYVYVRQGGDWTLQWHLFAWDGAAGDGFGTDVAIHGDRIAVGAPFDGGSGPGSAYARGSVYVFNRSGALWSPDAKVQAPAPLNGDMFGRSLVLGPDRLVVGAPGSADMLGRIHWYEKPAATWQNLGTLSAATVLPRQRYGWALARHDATLLVAAPFAALPATPSCGGVEHWTAQGPGYVAAPPVSLRSPRPGDLLGWSVAVSGSGLFVAAPGRNVSAQQQGSVAWFDPSRQMFDDSFERNDLCP